MGTAQEHREKREYALSLAYERIVGEFLTAVPVIESIWFERIEPDHWSIVHPAWRAHPDRKDLRIEPLRFSWRVFCLSDQAATSRSFSEA
ncbi:MAG UNVERIFIED_CONTAM: hypothetical protein MIN83_24635 [Paenibacillus polymyxa]|jgi:hypothetical protein